MHLLGCFFVIIFSLLLVFLGVLRSIAGAVLALFGIVGGDRRGSTGGANNPGGHSTRGTKYRKPNRKSGDNRIYPDNIGEYIDYEEVR